MAESYDDGTKNDGDYYYYYYDDDYDSEEVQEGYNKALPVNIIWSVSTGLAILAIIWALAASISNKSFLKSKDMPYIGFLVVNLLLLLLVEIPSIALYTTGVQVFNEETKYVHDVTVSLPFFSMAWMALQSWITLKFPSIIQAKVSTGIGAIFLFLGIAIALPLSISFSLIQDDKDIASKYSALFLVAFIVQKVIPATITIGFSTATYIFVRKQESAASIKHALILIMVVMYSLVWIAEDIHVMIYMFGGATLKGLELYHLAIYNLAETTAVLIAMLLIIAANQKMRIFVMKKRPEFVNNSTGSMKELLSPP